jgi:hypothetical protein
MPAEISLTERVRQYTGNHSAEKRAIHESARSGSKGFKFSLRGLI